ncbi:hypothetical protein DFH06DRAFT_1326762 [Mycena polygramma]|nr:hypothetical protein DFH06DRAFT_1326762 [Mycena polygramma]
MPLLIKEARVWFKVPNFHLPPHKPAWHSAFSFHFMWGAGRTHGETVEQNWEFTNGAAASTKMMGLGRMDPHVPRISPPHASNVRWACDGVQLFGPGVNMPQGWEEASMTERFLYTLFLAMDACFRLKRRLVSSELKDPDLGPGWAYLLNTMPYHEYLRSMTDQKEINSCSGLAALDFANTKFSRGYSTTGVGMGVCARHEFVQPNGVGDLQRGERFANMDYIFACIMHHKHPQLFTFVTYDIMCSWKVNLQERLTKLPPKIRLLIVLALMCFAIPEMDIHSHTLLCQLLYSINIILGSAEVEGGSHRASVVGYWQGRDKHPRHGPGSVPRRAGFPVFLLELAEARGVGGITIDVFEEFSSHQADRVPAWREEVLAHELDTKKKNPFEIKVDGLTEAQVRLQFTKEEAEEAKRGLPSVHDVSPSSFIIAGLDVEEDQRRVRVQAELKKAQTTGQQIDLTSMRTKLNRGIARFRKIQQTYMPAAIQSTLRHCFQLHSEKYQNEWEVIRRLNGGDERMIGWRALMRDDIRCMEDPEDLRKKAKAREVQAAKRKTMIANRIEEGMLPAEMDDDLEPIPGVERGPENQRQVSWIWTLAGADGTDAGLENEWEAGIWEARAAAVPIGVLSRANAEGAVAYAMRHVDMYRGLRERAEKTWTEPQLPRGKKCARHIPSALSAIQAEEEAESAEPAALEILHNNLEWDEDDDDDEVLRGDIESDEEYILGGEGYDD